MEKLKSELEELLRRVPDQTAFRQRLDNLVSVYPFNEYEYIISTLLAMDVLSLDAYHDLRNAYIARERYSSVNSIGHALCLKEGAHEGWIALDGRQVGGDAGVE